MTKSFISSVCWLGGIVGACLSLGYLVLTHLIAHAWGGNWSEEKTGFTTLGLSLLAMGVSVILKKVRPDEPESATSADLMAREDELKKRANEGKL